MTLLFAFVIGILAVSKRYTIISLEGSVDHRIILQ